MPDSEVVEGSSQEEAAADSQQAVMSLAGEEPRYADSQEKGLGVVVLQVEADSPFVVVVVGCLRAAMAASAFWAYQRIPWRRNPQGFEFEVATCKARRGI